LQSLKNNDLNASLSPTPLIASTTTSNASATATVATPVSHHNEHSSPKLEDISNTPEIISSVTSSAAAVASSADNSNNLSSSKAIDDILIKKLKNDLHNHDGDDEENPNSGSTCVNNKNENDDTNEESTDGLNTSNCSQDSANTSINLSDEIKNVDNEDYIVLSTIRMVDIQTPPVACSESMSSYSLCNNSTNLKKSLSSSNENSHSSNQEDEINQGSKIILRSRFLSMFRLENIYIIDFSVIGAVLMS
jgi:hypothetical protein